MINLLGKVLEQGGLLWLITVMSLCVAVLAVFALIHAN